MNAATLLKAIASPDNPREVLVDLIETNDGVKREQLFELFRGKVAGSQALTRAVQWYFFINMYEYATTSRNQGPRAAGKTRASPSERTEKRILQDEMVASIKQQLVLLDLVMPNEKLMRDCTGQEMSRFGNRYQRIAEQVGKTNLVGDVLDEDAVRAIVYLSNT